VSPRLVAVAAAVATKVLGSRPSVRTSSAFVPPPSITAAAATTDKFLTFAAATPPPETRAAAAATAAASTLALLNPQVPPVTTPAGRPGASVDYNALAQPQLLVETDLGIPPKDPGLGRIIKLRESEISTRHAAKYHTAGGG
jgi:hypothetical protein